MTAAAPRRPASMSGRLIHHMALSKSTTTILPVTSPTASKAPALPLHGPLTRSTSLTYTTWPVTPAVGVDTPPPKPVAL